MRRSLLLLLIFATRLAAAEPPLDTVAKLRALSPDEAALARPLLFEATVIYFDPQRQDLFVGDDTASTYVSTTTLELRTMSLRPGSRVRIEGVSRPGGFFPDVVLKRLDLLGQGELPRPRHLDEGDLMSPALDSQWVEISAVVTGVESAGLAFTLSIEVHGWKLKVEIPSDEYATDRAASLMQRPVRLQGCVGTVFNSQRQMTGRFFYVPSFDHIIPTDTLGPAFKPPLRQVIELLRSDDTTQTLVRVAGVVTQSEENDFNLRDESGSVMVRTARSEPFAPGTRVIAEGFAAVNAFRPILRARSVEVVGVTNTPAPVALDLALQNLTPFHAELVTLDADFLARREGPVEITLQCSKGDRFFEAVIPTGGVLPETLTAGDQVRLTGICELTTTHPMPRIEWVDGFKVHLPKVGGVTVLRRTPWWTLQRTLVVLSIVSAVALGALTWVRMLRVRVRKQTDIIGLQVQRVAVQDERQRIARELHDTVEQGLTGLSMQLGNISRDIAESPGQADSALQLAQQMLRHCRDEARASICDLRSIELEQRGLAGTLQELLPPLASGHGRDFHLTVTGSPRHLAATTENHLLRIAQECVTNAVRHAAAHTITVTLDYAPDNLSLTVRDDGCGFNADTPAPPGHFGLLGIRERTNKIQASLSLESMPETGTVISIIVPNKPAATDPSP